MTIQDELIEYANRCINDEIVDGEDYISGQAHKWACERYLNDVKRSSQKDCFFYWDESEAQNIVDWFSYLRHSKGILARQPIILTPWQKFDLCQLYGWRRCDTKKRRFRKSLFEVGRKNAKSQEEAGVSLYEAAVTSTRNGEVNEIYTAGTKKEQSKIVFKEAGLMLRGSPLRSKFKINRDAITHIKTGSSIVPLSKDDGKNGDGTNPACLILDEYHQHQNTDYYDLGLGSNTQEPLLMIITTAGKDLTYPCYVQEYTYCKKVLDPSVDVLNDEYLIDICELDPEDYADISRLENRRVWRKANPIRMSYTQGQEKIEGEYKLAVEIPEKMTAFLTKCMDVWVMAKENGYMDMAKWKACQCDSIPDTKGMPVYVGFDMSAKIDLTSVSFVIPMETDKKDEQGKTVIQYIVESHSFVPSIEKIMEHVHKDHAAYDSWARGGYISITDTPIVNQAAVMEYVITTCRERDWHIECLCFDPANAGKLMMDMSDEGYTVEEVFQSHKSLNESTQGFREQVYSKNILAPYNPVLNFAMSNAVIRRYNGLIKIDKDATPKRIDPVDATLCAYKLAMYHTFGDSFDEEIDKYLNS